MQTLLDSPTGYYFQFSCQEIDDGEQNQRGNHHAAIQNPFIVYPASLNELENRCRQTQRVCYVEDPPLGILTSAAKKGSDLKQRWTPDGGEAYLHHTTLFKQFLERVAS